MTTFRKLAN